MQYTDNPEADADAYLSQQAKEDAELNQLEEGAMRLLLEDLDPQEIVEYIYDANGLLALIIKSYRANVKNPDGDAINAEIELMLRSALKKRAKEIAKNALAGF